MLEDAQILMWPPLMDCGGWEWMYNQKVLNIVQQV